MQGSCMNRRTGIAAERGDGKGRSDPLLGPGGGETAGFRGGPLLERLLRTAYRHLQLKIVIFMIIRFTFERVNC